MMKTMKKLLCAFLIVLVVLMAAPCVWAADTTVSTNRSSMTVGQTVTATVTFRGTLAAVQFSINYSPSVLRYESYSSSSDLTVNATSGVVTAAVMTSDGANASSVSCSFTFTAVGAGSSGIGVYVNDCIDEGGNPVTCSDGSATVTVNASSNTPAPQAPQTPQTPEEPQVQAEPIEIAVDGASMHLMRSLSGIEIPEEFEVAEDEYAGEMIEVARGINQDILLMYLTKPDGSGGGFYRYLRAENAFYPFYRLSVNASRFTVMELPESVTVPAGWEPFTFVYGQQQIPGYRQNGVEKGLYLVYASNGEGMTGWYLYDPLEGTVQRYTVQADAPAANSGGLTETVKGYFGRLIADREVFVTVCVSWALILLVAGAWLVTHLVRKYAHVSDKTRKRRETRMTKRLEKRAARMNKKQEPQALEIGVLEDEPAEPEEKTE